MDYKLIAVDMDGTLLNSSFELSQATIDSIKYAIEKGNIFTVSTGRPPQGVANINALLPFDLPFILYNGAVVMMCKSKKIIYEQNLSPKHALEVVELGKKCGTTVIVWCGGDLYVSEINDDVRSYQQISKLKPKIIEDIHALAAKGITKIIWFDDPQKLLTYQSDMQQHFKGELNCHTSRTYLLEFVDIKASKAEAMEQIGRYYGIDKNEMIAVGDGYNDVSMLKYAGLGVAMANAPQDVKDCADYVTLSNDCDGVAAVIYKYM